MCVCLCAISQCVCVCVLMLCSESELQWALIPGFSHWDVPTAAVVSLPLLSVVCYPQPQVHWPRPYFFVSSFCSFCLHFLLSGPAPAPSICNLFSLSYSCTFTLIFHPLQPADTLTHVRSCSTLRMFQRVCSVTLPQLRVQWGGFSNTSWCSYSTSQY